jgi:hypothetical protein
VDSKSGLDWSILICFMRHFSTSDASRVQASLPTLTLEKRRAIC